MPRGMLRVRLWSDSDDILRLGRVAGDAIPPVQLEVIALALAVPVARARSGPGSDLSRKVHGMPKLVQSHSLSLAVSPAD